MILLWFVVLSLWQPNRKISQLHTFRLSGNSQGTKIHHSFQSGKTLLFFNLRELNQHEIG